MKKIVAIVSVFLTTCVITQAQRPESLNKYDLNRPFGWAVYDGLNPGFTLSGGGSASAATIVSDGTDMTDRLQSALNSSAVLVLDGSKGDFLISSGLYINSTVSYNKTVVGINGATIRQINCVDEAMHAYLSGRFSGETRKDKSGYVQSRNITVPKEDKWYVQEGDELYVRGYMIDYYYEKQGVRDEQLLLSEPWKSWGCLRINSDSSRDYYKSGSNIIIRNITFIGPGSLDLSAQDAFCLNGCHNVWVDHCHFQDGQDGNLDIVASGSRNSTNVTISWCTFSYGRNSFDHRFNTLLSQRDPSTSYITFANCHWMGGAYFRTPMGTAKAHIVNCLYDAPGAGGRIESRSKDVNVPFYVDHCYFAAGRNRNDTRTYIYSTADHGFYYCEGNYAANGENPVSNAGKPYVPYQSDYQYIPVELLPTVLTSPNGAGPTLTDPLKITY